MIGLPRRVEQGVRRTVRTRAWLRCATLLWAGLVGSTAMAADWEATLHPDDRHSIQQSDTVARTMLQSIGPELYGHEEVAGVQALLEARRLPRPQERLIGDWRCRSIQLNTYGLFSYPYFRCHIERIDAGLRFRKSTGSQRRTGLLHSDGEARWVFVGSSHYNDDPPTEYSGLHQDSDGEDRERDSVGVLDTLADGRLRMILDAGNDGVELYELQR